MNVLLTGGTGYIGSHAAVVLSQLGHQVVLYDNLSNSSDAVLERLAQITGQRIPFVRGDVRDTELLRNALASHGIDAVIHFAWLKAVGECVEKPVAYYANNVQGAISLLQAMQAACIKTLAFSSSATVYGEPVYLPYDESHLTRAAHPYGRCKLHIEEMLTDVAASDPERKVAYLRHFNPVGAHESGLIGENPKGIPNNLMPYIAQVAPGQCEAFNVFGGDYPTRDGTGVRDYIHVMDLAEGHAVALPYLVEHPSWHAINLSTGQGCSVVEMIPAFEESSGRKVPYRLVARRAGDLSVLYANPQRAFELLNRVAKRTLKDMCASTWRFLKSVEFKRNL